VIDHEVDTIQTIQDAADMLGGIDVHVARTAYEAGVLTVKIEPRVAVLNARLPDIDILTACRTLKKSNGSPSAELIVMATKFRQEELDALKEDGVENFIRKPMCQEEFLAMLRKSLAG
jgi:CheY-like chemotaxis protein